MKNPSSPEVRGSNGATKVFLEWLEDEPFCLCLRKKTSRDFKPLKRERTKYVKLVIDLPDYCAHRSRARFRRRCGDSGMDRASSVCGFPRSIPRLHHLRAQTSVEV